MPTTKAQQRATAKYTRNNYDQISVKFPKGTKQRIQSTGESLNGFINRAVEDRLKRQGE